MMTSAEFKRIPIVDEDEAGSNYLAVAYAKQPNQFKELVTRGDGVVWANGFDWAIITSKTGMCTLGLRYRLELFAGRRG